MYVYNYELYVDLSVIDFLHINANNQKYENPVIN